LAHLRKLCVAEVIEPATVVFNADTGSQRLEELLTGDAAALQTAPAGAPFVQGHSVSMLAHREAAPSTNCLANPGPNLAMLRSVVMFLI
jgi:hypothetical protein